MPGLAAFLSRPSVFDGSIEHTEMPPRLTKGVGR